MKIKALGHFVFLKRVEVDFIGEGLIVRPTHSRNMVLVSQGEESKYVESLKYRPTFEKYEVVDVGHKVTLVKEGDFVMASKMATPRPWRVGKQWLFRVHEDMLDAVCGKDTIIDCKSETPPETPTREHIEDKIITRRFSERKVVGRIAPRGGKFDQS